MGQIEVNKGAQDRIFMQLDRSYSVAQYETIKISLGLSSDRAPNESLQQAFERVEDEVGKEFNSICKHIEGKHQTKSKGAL